MIHWNDLLHDDFTDLKAMIEHHHYQENMTQQMIADHLGISETALKTKSKELGVVYKIRYGKVYSRHPEMRGYFGG